MLFRWIVNWILNVILRLTSWKYWFLYIYLSVLMCVIWSSNKSDCWDFTEYVVFNDLIFVVQDGGERERTKSRFSGNWKRRFFRRQDFQDRVNSGSVVFGIGTGEKFEQRNFNIYQLLSLWILHTFFKIRSERATESYFSGSSLKCRCSKGRHIIEKCEDLKQNINKIINVRTIFF